MLKAVREGKEHSSWSYPDAEYEAALQRFVRGALDATRPNPFLADFAEFAASLARPSAIASLAQLVLKLTVPCVADLYQGGELWDFSLVDPDNRRPVDFSQRQRLLAELEGATASDLMRGWQDGREKLFVARTLLALRREHPDLFAAGDYQPLEIGDGRNSDRVCAFSRFRDPETLVVAVPRLTWALYKDGASADWGATEIALPKRSSWRDVFSDRVLPGHGRIRASEVFAEFPVAVLFGGA
jgi:(1->4)-alpha-D-glucan 1-alpha-D-glucosylmutase